MEAAPSAKPRRESPPIPPNYVSLRQLQELRLKEKEEQEKRQREAETKRRAASLVSSGEAKEKRGAGKEQRHGHGHQWVAVAHRPPATTPRPAPAGGEVAAEKREGAAGGGCGKRPDGVADDGPRGGCKPHWKGKGKGEEKASSYRTVNLALSLGGKPAEVVSASSHCGKPATANKREPKAKGKASGGQTAESSSSGGPGEPDKAAVAPSRDHFRRKGVVGAVGRSAETFTTVAPAKTAGPSPPRALKSDNTGKLKPPAPKRVDAGVGSDSSEGKKAAPARAPPTSAGDGSSKSAKGGDLRKTMEAKPEGLVEGQRRRLVVEVQAVTELNPRVARSSAGPLRGRGTGPAEQHGRVWVPKAAAAAGSSAGAEL